MNCRDFQHEIFEYLEGSLATASQAAAEEHLARCADCRELVNRQRQFARSISERLHRATASLQLPTDVGRRVLAEVHEQRALLAERRGWRWFWQRLELPLAMATCAVVLLAGMWLVRRDCVPQLGTAQSELDRRPVSVQLSYVVPTYTFRRENGQVIDALIYQTTVVSETRHVDSPRRN